MNFAVLAEGDYVTLARQWLQIAAQSKALFAARQLYAGVGWGYALCAQKLLGSDCELWIVSAGFGLVAGDEQLPSYAATFAAEKGRVAGKLLGFHSSSSAHGAWWKSINDARGRTQTPLKNTFANYDRVIVALSSPYLVALKADLEILAQTLGPEKLWIIAVGAEARRLSPELIKCVVPLTVEMERLISSSRTTLNLRVLLWWLEEIIPVAGWNRAKQNRKIQRRLSTLKPKTVRVKQSLSDDEVMRWIEAQKRQQGNEWPRGGKTGLLRTLRESGMACEQNRFSRLYKKVTASA